MLSGVTVAESTAQKDELILARNDINMISQSAALSAAQYEPRGLPHRRFRDPHLPPATPAHDCPQSQQLPRPRVPRAGLVERVPLTRAAPLVFARRLHRRTPSALPPILRLLPPSVVHLVLGVTVVPPSLLATISAALPALHMLCVDVHLDTFHPRTVERRILGAPARHHSQHSALHMLCVDAPLDAHLATFHPGTVERRTLGASLCTTLRLPPGLGAPLWTLRLGAQLAGASVTEICQSAQEAVEGFPPAYDPTPWRRWVVEWTGGGGEVDVGMDGHDALPVEEVMQHLLTALPLLQPLQTRAVFPALQQDAVPVWLSRMTNSSLHKCPDEHPALMPPRRALCEAPALLIAVASEAPGGGEGPGTPRARSRALLTAATRTDLTTPAPPCFPHLTPAGVHLLRYALVLAPHPATRLRLVACPRRMNRTFVLWPQSWRATGSGSPKTPANTFRAVNTAISARVSNVALPMCGSTTHPSVRGFELCVAHEFRCGTGTRGIDAVRNAEGDEDVSCCSDSSETWRTLLRLAGLWRDFTRGPATTANPSTLVVYPAMLSQVLTPDRDGVGGVNCPSRLTQHNVLKGEAIACLPFTTTTMSSDVPTAKKIALGLHIDVRDLALQSLSLQKRLDELNAAHLHLISVFDTLTTAHGALVEVQKTLVSCHDRLK
ncbi:hypothetical protein B0H17DRAFT_1209397 [Mycena rosella]|uniref:Uncharacterized protein n=1 Tax=Mycena rosella TaxID=1033263 RepID=A0AAD7G5Q7_MYCRO|nr:hypothetical protein B0H17DRAFT_1209397 [Mycena rosella]